MMKTLARNFAWVALRGAAAILFGLLTLVAPGAGALAMAAWIGTFALVSGVLLVTLALRLRSWDHERAAGATPHPA